MNYSIRKILTFSLLASLLALTGFSSAQNISLTPEELAQLQSLSPAQREALLGGQSVPAQAQVTDPIEVIPRAAAAPNQDGIQENVQSRLGQETLAEDVELQETPAPGCADGSSRF